jgi:hypothetical protein
MRNGAAPGATDRQFFSARQVREPIMTPPGVVSAQRGNRVGKSTCQRRDLSGLCPIEIRFFRIPRPGLPTLW